MTQKQKNALMILGAVPTGAAVAFFLIATAFVPRSEFDATRNDVSNLQRADSAQIREQAKIGCYVRFLAGVPGYTKEGCALQ